MAKGNLPFESLAAVSAAGPGVVNDLQDTLASHSLVATVSGFSGTGNWTISLQVSLDNVTWRTLATYSLNENVSIGLVGSFAARYVRADLEFNPGTTTSITATAWIASA